MTSGAGRAITVIRRTVGRRGSLSVALLALVAYGPLFVARRGLMVTDTKLYLYLDPGRLVSDAGYAWDSRQFGGWVPHQVIAYLWPQGPWYWTFDRFGVPDWIAHRMWVGTVLLVGGLGARWLSGRLGLGTVAASLAALAYQTSPYVLPYVSRTSSMLLPWAGLGWIVGLTLAASTSTRRWVHPAALALVVATCGAVNATALLVLVPGPLLALVDAVLRRVVTLRRAVATAFRIAIACSASSVWWVAMNAIQGSYGADLLGYSESLQATSFTSASTEVLRGMGYWLFYVRDPFAFTTTAARTFMSNPAVIALGFVLLAVSMLGLVVVRWTHRRLAVLLVAVGTVLAVGVHPIEDPSPLMVPLAERSRSFLALALRSSARATPLLVLGLSLGIGALCAAVARATGERRPRGGTRQHVGLGLGAVAVVSLVLAANPALFDGTMVDPALVRQQDLPDSWSEAADVLSAGDLGARVLQLPGTEFGAFDWGYTVDPPLPGLTDKPILTRDLLPLGSPGLMDLFYALDDRFQEGTAEPASIASVARLLGADTVWLSGDLAFERFRAPWPAEARAVLADATAMRPLAEFGQRRAGEPVVALVDERLYGPTSPEYLTVPEVELFAVTSPVPVARTVDHLVVLAGSGDGVIDAAAAGLLDGTEAILYAADLASTPDRRGSLRPVLVILTDSNRDRAHHWRSSQDVHGYTERGGTARDSLVVDESDRRLPVFGERPDPLQQTVAYLDDGLVVRASGYGEPFAFLPEFRPAMAVDGDPGTAWLVGTRGDPVGERLEVSATDGELVLLQPQRPANRRITEIEIRTADGQTSIVALDDSSMVPPGQPVALAATGAVTITITAVGPTVPSADSGPSGVGFAELGIGTHHEWVRLPAPPSDAADAPTAVVLTRLRVDPRTRWRSDPEPLLRREFESLEGGDWTVEVTLRLSPTASDTVIGRITGRRSAVASRRLPGSAWAGGPSAVDGDLSTAWTTPFGQAVGSSLRVLLDGPLQSFDLLQPTDGRHSTITSLEIRSDDGTFDVDLTPDADGRSTVRLPTAVDGASIDLVITAIDPATTVDRRYGESVELPAAITEIETSSIAVGAPTAPWACRDDLLEIDGRAFAVEVSLAELDALADGKAVTVPGCDAAELGAGVHRVEATGGTSTGLDVDRVVLRSWKGSPRPPAAPTVMTQANVEGTRTRRTITVQPCPAGCWLVWGEGYNSGWAATVDGRSLDEPTPLNGGNGWWIEPSARPTTVRIEFLPQRLVTICLLVSLAAALAATAVLIATACRRRTRTDVDPVGDQRPTLAALVAPSPERYSWAGAIVLVVVSGFAVAPPAALVVAPLGIAMIATRRARFFGLVSPALVLLIGAYVTIRQATERIPADAAWVAAWDRVHRPGLAAVAVLLAAAIGAPDHDGIDSDDRVRTPRQLRMPRRRGRP